MQTTLEVKMNELRQPFDDMARMLRLRASGKQVCFLLADGNYGDGLIRHAAELFLQDAGIAWRPFDMSSRKQKLQALALAAADPHGTRNFFVFNGGGGWAPQCSSSLRAVDRQMKVSPDVFVLPSTVEMMPLTRIPTIYRRDKAESCQLVPDAPFCHDMAFYLALIPRDRWFPAAAETPVDRAKGIFFRSDNESRFVGGGQLPGSEDISVRGNHMSDIQLFLKEIARCEEVITDRLHVAIAGVLLGRRVSLVPGKTFKIRAIYDASIAPYFDNCELISDEEAVRRAGA